MMMATFQEYQTARTDTTDKARSAESNKLAVETATAALSDATAVLDDANISKAEAYDAWQKSERLENKLATELGIDPKNPVPTPPA